MSYNPKKHKRQTIKDLEKYKRQAKEDLEEYERQAIEDVGVDEPNTGNVDEADKADNKTNKIYGNSNNTQKISYRRLRRVRRTSHRKCRNGQPKHRYMVAEPVILHTGSIHFHLLVASYNCNITTNLYKYTL